MGRIIAVFEHDFVCADEIVFLSVPEELDIRIEEADWNDRFDEGEDLTFDEHLLEIDGVSLVPVELFEYED
jgi:hypothetical protein